MTPEQLAEIKRNWHTWPVTALIAEAERLQVLIAWSEGSIPGKQAARLCNCDGFELTLMLENAIKAGKGQSGNDL